MDEGFTHFIVDSHTITPLQELREKDLDAALQSLVAQEIHEWPVERVPERLNELMQRLGFGWEANSEPGQMRFFGNAAIMLWQARAQALQVARSMMDQLGISFSLLDGVNLLETAAPALQDYLALTAAERGLYGDSPYLVQSNGRTLMLRQTACVQKLVACQHRNLTHEQLPCSIFEISDSYRHEPEETLQLCFRVRRFRLPEAHIHARGLQEALWLSERLHGIILDYIRSLEFPCTLLVSVQHSFLSSRTAYLRKLAADLAAPFLLKVYPPGSLCKDGVEVDVEYKVIDSLGVPREFSTFQIDERISESFGLKFLDSNGALAVPATIHAVFTGSVERYLYFMLDQIIATEQRGQVRPLPLWLAPVMVRILEVNPGSDLFCEELATQLQNRGIRTELDDRRISLECKIEQAIAELVPYQVLIEQPHSGTLVKVRDGRTDTIMETDFAVFVDQLQRDMVGYMPCQSQITRLSARTGAVFSPTRL